MRLFGLLMSGAIACASTLIVVPTSAAADDSVAQLCDATSIEEVNDILKDVTDTDLLNSLDDLISIKAPVVEDVVDLDNDVKLEDIKLRLKCEDKKKPFKNCAEARRLGKAPVSRNDERFQSKLDVDGDGIGCEGNGDDDRDRRDRDDNDSKDDNDNDSKDDNDSDKESDSDSDNDSESTPSGGSQVSRYPVGAPETGGE